MPRAPKGKISGNLRRFPNMRETLAAAAKKPRIGVTQGGSSKEHSGAVPAATKATIRQHKSERMYDKS